MQFKRNQNPYDINIFKHTLIWNQIWEVAANVFDKKSISLEYSNINRFDSYICNVNMI